MLDFMKLLNNDMTNLTKEEREQTEKFTEDLKEKMIDELVEYEAENLAKKLNDDKEDFIESIGQILINGCKGYRKMNIQLLLNIYLEKMGNERFVSLVENI